VFVGTVTSLYHSIFTRTVALGTQSFYLNNNKVFLPVLKAKTLTVYVLDALLWPWERVG
jgi:hypothetical protein